MEAMDRISVLPDVLLHDILSLLDTPSAARTCLLSKRWYFIWSSFPILNLKLHVPRSGEDNVIRYIDRSFDRLIRQDLPLKKLNLLLTYYSARDNLVWRLNHWLDQALCNGAEDISFGVETSFHPLAETMFDGWPIQGLSRGFHDLKCLLLRDVRMSDRVARNLVRNCPNIEHLELRNVTGLQTLGISNLQKLERVIITPSASDDVQRIDIDALKMKEFQYASGHLPTSSQTMSLRSCHSLTALKLFGCNAVTDEWLVSHLPTFPLLESLEFRKCPKLRRVRVSAPRLEKLALQECENIEAIDMDAPRLGAFLLCARSYPVLRYENSRLMVIVKLHLQHTKLDMSWFLKFRRNLAASTLQHKIICLYLGSGLNVTFDLKELMDEVPPMVNVYDLTIDYGDFSRPIVECGRLIDGLLWSCHPVSISMHYLGHHPKFNCIKELANKLLERDVVEPACCDNSAVKCWRHELKGWKVNSICRRVTPSSKLPSNSAPVWDVDILQKTSCVAGIFNGIKEDDRLPLISSLLARVPFGQIHYLMFLLEWNQSR